MSADAATSLRSQHCEACNAQTPALDIAALASAREQLDASWSVDDDGRVLRRALRLRDFASAFTLATRIALLAEVEGHHPELHVGWGHLDIELTTHAVGALTRNDVVLAARIDALVAEHVLRAADAG